MSNTDSTTEKKRIFEEEALPHLSALYRTARRLTMNTEEAQDLVQETYLRAYRSFARYEPGTNCRAWLFRILTNLQINRYQKQRRRPVHLSFDDTEEFYLYQQAADQERFHDGGDPEKLFMESVVDDEVKQAVTSLPHDFQMAVLLSDVEGFSYKEISGIMDCPIGTVRSRIHRGRRLLQKQLWEFAKERLGLKALMAGAGGASDGHSHRNGHPDPQSEDDETPWEPNPGNQD